MAQASNDLILMCKQDMKNINSKIFDDKSYITSIKYDDLCQQYNNLKDTSNELLSILGPDSLMPKKIKDSLQEIVTMSSKNLSKITDKSEIPFELDEKLYKQVRDDLIRYIKKYNKNCSIIYTNYMKKSVVSGDDKIELIELMMEFLQKHGMSYIAILNDDAKQFMANLFLKYISQLQ